jgi:NTE family protein
MQRKVIKSNKSNTTSKTKSADNNTQKLPLQRALVLQGGAALGAYEAGVYKELYEWIIEKDSHTGGSKDSDRNVFDIIAGTSAGAINAALLVDHVRKKRLEQDHESNIGQKRKNWADSTILLEDFWISMSTRTIADYYHQFFEYLTQTPFGALFAASEMFAESFRKYYSVKQLQSFGARHVFQPVNMFGLPSPVLSPTPDFKFYSFLFLPFPYNLSSNVWFRYSNDPLKDAIREYWDGDMNPLGTNYDAGEPRLLVVSIDVKEGETVTFDSYADPGNECRICGKTKEELNKEVIEHVYTDHQIPYDDQVQYRKEQLPSILRWSVYGDNKKRYVISYGDGLTLKHIVASASVPIVFKYEPIETLEFNFDDSDEEVDRGNGSTITDKVKEKSIGQMTCHKFWDGQFLSNTPLRELIGAHTTFWKDEILAKKIPVSAKSEGDREKWSHTQDFDMVPDLEVYIVNVWPSKEEMIPLDHDGQEDRKNDIMFHDKSEYDEKVARFTTDYIDLANELIKLARTNGVPEDKIMKILNKDGQSRFRTGERRKYSDLLVGRFGVKKVIRIERADDPTGISEKWGDYSYETICNLFEQGRKDTLRTLIQEELVKVIDDAISNNDRSRNQIKYALMKPIRKAASELPKTWNVLDQVAKAHTMITMEFIKEIQNQKSFLSKIPQEKFMEGIQTSEDLPTYLIRTANFIAARLNPAKWQDENIDKEKQYQKLGREQPIMSSYGRAPASA